MYLICRYHVTTVDRFGTRVHQRKTCGGRSQRPSTWRGLSAVRVVCIMLRESCTTPCAVVPVLDVASTANIIHTLISSSLSKKIGCSCCLAMSAELLRAADTAFVVFFKTFFSSVSASQTPERLIPKYFFFF